MAREILCNFSVPGTLDGKRQVAFRQVTPNNGLWGTRAARFERVASK